MVDRLSEAQSGIVRLGNRAQAASLAGKSPGRIVVGAGFWEEVDYLGVNPSQCKAVAANSAPSRQ